MLKQCIVIFNNNTVCYHHLVKRSCRVYKCIWSTWPQSRLVLYNNVRRNTSKLSKFESRRHEAWGQNIWQKEVKRPAAWSSPFPMLMKGVQGLGPWKIEGSIKTTISSSCPEICLLWPNCWQYVAKGQNELGAIKGQHNAWLGSRLQGWGKKVEVGLVFHVTSSTKMSMSLVITREGETCFEILPIWLSTLSMLSVLSCQENSILQLHKH